MDHEYISEWFNHGDMDFQAAELLLASYPLLLEIICYHCQQAAEKYLKGYLAFTSKTERPRTHDLVLLLAECMKSDERFNDIQRACAVLTRYGVQPRYPNEMEINEDEMHNAVMYMRKIRNIEPLIELRNMIM